MPKKVVRKPIRKAAPAPTTGIRKETVDTSQVKARPVRNQPNAERLGHGNKELPFDLPVFITVHRLVSNNDGGLEGHVIELDCFTFGRTVYVRIGRPEGWRKGHSPDASANDGLLKVFVDKRKVYEGQKGDNEDRWAKKG